jgi:IS605 OrfB family transposase
VQSKKGVWYACISVSWEVPRPTETPRFIGVDRGQNHLAVAVTPEGRSLFLSFGWVRHIRRRYAAKRRRLQQKGKHKTLKRLEQKESRTIRHINHIISKKLVGFAKEHGGGIRMEDLSGIRQSKQRQSTKAKADLNRDFWLESKTAYKALGAGVAFEKVPAAYTSKTCCRCGAMGSGIGTASGANGVEPGTRRPQRRVQSGELVGAVLLLRRAGCVAHPQAG